MPDTRPAPDNLLFTDLNPVAGDVYTEVLAGLTGTPKQVNPKWFYDEKGSELFDQITQLPEYYPTRTETALLKTHAQAIAAHCPKACVLIEPGSGSCEKVRLLLDALRPSTFVPIDISSDFLRGSAASLAEEYPWLPVHAVCADFNQSWSFLDDLPNEKRVVFYPGSTIGNLEPAAAKQFLGQIRDIIGSTGGAIIGVDLHKQPDRLNAAYNDSQGITARFNLNLLSHLNAALEAGFEVDQFQHEAFYNEALRRIEMHLVSTQRQSVRVNGAEITFDTGERLHTESSYKYSVDDFARLADSAGLAVRESWIDADQLFSVHYLTSAT